MVFGIFDFLKNTNENRLFSSKKRFSFVFLRKLKTPQSHFEINWPLKDQDFWKQNSEIQRNGRLLLCNFIRRSDFGSQSKQDWKTFYSHRLRNDKNKPWYKSEPAMVPIAEIYKETDEIDRPKTKEIHDPFCFACTLGLLPCLCRCPQSSTKLNEYS